MLYQQENQHIGIQIEGKYRMLLIFTKGMLLKNRSCLDLSSNHSSLIVTKHTGYKKGYKKKITFITS